MKGGVATRCRSAFCPECGRGAQLAAGELVPVAPEVTAMAECDGQHLGTIPLPRAKQTIPPAKRRAAMQRDQHRCRVPGCRNATFVDVHHITARADGGGHDVDNLIVLCGAHHRGVHRGELVLEGVKAADLRFRHADGCAYGSPASPASMAVHASVFSALCNMGFREAQVRRVLDGLRREADLAPVTFDALLRQALDRLTPRGQVHHD